MHDVNSGSMQQQAFVGLPQNAASSSNNNCSRTIVHSSRAIVAEVSLCANIIKHCSFSFL
jgi:hypothetical protein